jgi:GNAT superfamily N-acetyltransferase
MTTPRRCLISPIPGVQIGGDTGRGYLPYSYFSKRFLEGWTIISFDTRSSPKKKGGIELRHWGIEDLLGNILHGREIVDSNEDEIFAWGFAIEGKAFLEIEELFVRPNWRRCGYATQLTGEFSQLSARLAKKLRAWIPHPDAEKSNQQALNAVLSQLGLSCRPSPVRWAAAVGE